jgi:hypothetical protein
MTREEKVKWIIEAIDMVEGVTVSPSFFEKHTDEDLDKEMDWYDYLLGK